MKVVQLNKPARRFEECRDLGNLKPFLEASLHSQLEKMIPEVISDTSKYLVFSEADEEQIKVLSDQLYGNVCSWTFRRVGSIELLLRSFLKETPLTVTLLPADGDGSRHYGDKGEWRTAIGEWRTAIQAKC